MEEITKNRKIELQLYSQDLFAERETYISPMRMFLSYFKTIPNIKGIDGINSQRFKKWFAENYKSQIIKIHFQQEYSRRKKKMMHMKIVYLLKNGLLLDLEFDCVRIFFKPSDEKAAQQLIIEIKKFLRRVRRTTSISLVIKDSHGLETRGLNLKKPELNLSKNYNDDLISVHQTTLSSLKTKGKSGLFLFYGSPGTGKSTYIRHLIHQLNKKVLFLPPRLAGNLDNPELGNLLLTNQNSVFVIEDAEELLIAREHGNHSSISMLLNLTDGLLGESLGIQVIATFNTIISNIDKALLRKGRLIALYEFKSLETIKANALLESLGIQSRVSQPSTLADIYNIRLDTFEFRAKQQQQIGFMKQIV